LLLSFLHPHPWPVAVGELDTGSFERPMEVLHDARVASRHESGIKDAGTGGLSWVRPLATIDLRAQIRGEKMDTKPKNDKPADFDLEMAVFGAP
jgi:hypothetical protein